MEKQVATIHEYDWIVTTLKGMASEDGKINEQLMLLEDAIKKERMVRKI